MNKKVHPQWQEQNYEWYRAAWLEAGELVDHYGYKWWKKQDCDLPQAQMEAIDIWHFGISSLFCDDKPEEAIVDGMIAELEGYEFSGVDVITATESLASDLLLRKKFSVKLFWDLMIALDLTPEELYKQYLGKNVLNFFRQDNGYKDGTYVKLWDGREDNEHLVELLDGMDISAPSLADDLYASLDARYKDLCKV